MFTCLVIKCRVLPWSQAPVGVVTSDVNRELKDKQRRQKARRQLLSLNKKKREEKIACLLDELGRLYDLRTQQHSLDIEEYQLLLEEEGYQSDEVGVAGVGGMRVVETNMNPLLSGSSQMVCSD